MAEWGRRAAVLVCGALAVALTSCEGVFSGIYDNDSDSGEQRLKADEIYIDAADWDYWYYVDLDSILALRNAGDSAALYRALRTHDARPIPRDSVEAVPADSAGIYTYWFDIFGKGLSVYERRSYRPTAPQAEPPHWTFAVHRDNVRTNGCAVYETSYTSLTQLPDSSAAFRDAQFQADTWSERDVWTDRTAMLSCLMGSEGIKINQVLSSWLTVNIPPIPPTFTYNGHVFILRLPDGRCAALRLKSYMDSAGTKCKLTIEYRFPY